MYSKCYAEKALKRKGKAAEEVDSEKEGERK